MVEWLEARAEIWAGEKDGDRVPVPPERAEVEQSSEREHGGGAHQKREIGASGNGFGSPEERRRKAGEAAVERQRETRAGRRSIGKEETGEGRKINQQFFFCELPDRVRDRVLVRKE